MRIRNLLDPGSGIEKFGPGINILDPQHCMAVPVCGVDAFMTYHTLTYVTDPEPSLPIPVMNKNRNKNYKNKV